MASSEARGPSPEALDAEVRRLLVETYDLDPWQVASLRSEEALFGAGLGLDSLDSMPLVIALEDHFGRPLRNDAATRKAFASLDSLVKHIASLLS